MNQIRNLYAKANASERHKMQEQLRDLQTDLDTDWEILFGLAMGVRLALSFLIVTRN